MNYLLFLVLLIIIVVFYYLAFIQESEREGFLVGTTGISQICDSSTTNPKECFDISYNDVVTGKPVQVRARIQPDYYIDASGYLDVVPYGYIVSDDKLSYIPKTKTAAYKKAIIDDENAPITLKITEIKEKMEEERNKPTPNILIITKLQTEINNLEQQKISAMNSNTTSNSSYNSDNFDITYHADPIPKTENGEFSGAGKMWVDISGTLVAIPYSDVSNTTLYYSSGDYIYNSASYVPNYEESVFLSSLTNLPTTSKVHDTADTQSGFCQATESSVLERESKCNALDPTVCGSTDCCVLLGGEKCVAGNINGPAIKSNYSDITIINRDYYYYRGKCYGHCS
jgi:hypothetical protein